MKRTANKIFLVFLYVMSAMIPISCGSRKVDLSKQSEINKDIEKESSKGNVSKISISSDSNKSTDQSDKTVKAQEQRITELFNETGSLTKRITELLNTESIDKSIKTNEVVKWRYLQTDSVFNNHYYHDRTITKTIKIKSTETNNKWLYILGGFIVVACLFYRYKTR